MFAHKKKSKDLLTKPVETVSESTVAKTAMAKEDRIVREIQDHWLQLPAVKSRIRAVGWHASIIPCNTAVTYADIRSGLYPNWLRWMQAEIEQEFTQ